MNPVVAFPTVETAMQTIESYARRSGMRPAAIAEVFTLGVSAARALARRDLLGTDEPLYITWGAPPVPADHPQEAHDAA